MPPAPPPPAGSHPIWQVVQKRPLLVSLGMVAFLVLVAWSVYGPHWETNDDGIMNLIAAGRVVTDAPDEHVFLQNVVIGLALQRAYLWAPGLPWYGAYLFTAAAVALVGSAYAILRSGAPVRQLPLACLFVLGVGLPALVGLHYTRIAALLSLGGALLLLVAAAEEMPWPGWLAGGLLVFAGSLVRFPAMLMPLLLLAPAVVARFVAAPAQRRWLLGLCFVLPVVGGYAMQQAHRWYYQQDEAWSEALGRVDVPVQIVDYRRFEVTPKTRPLLAGAGLAPVDVALVWNWNCLHLDDETLSRMRSVLASAGVGARMGDRYGRLSGDLGATQAYVCYALLVVGLLSAPGGWLAAGLCVATTAATFVVLCEFFKVEFYITHTMLAVTAAVSLLGPGPGGQAAGDWGAARKAAVGLAGLVAVVCVLTNAYQRYQVAAYNAWLCEGTEEALRRREPRPDQLHVVWWYHMLYANITPPLRGVRAPEGLRVVGTNMLASTPFTRKRFEQFGITGDPMLAFCRRQDVFVFNDEARNRLMAQYLWERHKARMGARAVLMAPSMEPSRLYSLIDVSLLPPEKGARPAPKSGRAAGLRGAR